MGATLTIIDPTGKTSQVALAELIRSAVLSGFTVTVHPHWVSCIPEGFANDALRRAMAEMPIATIIGHENAGFLQYLPPEVSTVGDLGCLSVQVIIKAQRQFASSSLDFVAASKIFAYMIEAGLPFANVANVENWLGDSIASIPSIAIVACQRLAERGIIWLRIVQLIGAVEELKAVQQVGDATVNRIKRVLEESSL